MRKQIAAANWKMNLTAAEANTLIESILRDAPELAPHQVSIYAVPFPYLQHSVELVKSHKNNFIAAQNCYFQKAGAFTGEVSASMIASIGVQYVVIGHSERREFFNENNQMLAAKVDMCLGESLKPIFCCGEPLSVREAGQQNKYVGDQLSESIFHLDSAQVENFIIAYEPIWAIGTGKTASPEQAEDMHKHLRNVLSDKYGNDIANTVSILYGGSVKASNAAEIFALPNVDGGLVGGASLIAADFIQIIKSLK